MKVELPLGDVVDKVSILLLKAQHIRESEKAANIQRELVELRQSWQEAGHPPMESLESWAGLCEINGKLWAVEDELRALERVQDFSEVFVAAARSVYFLNDRRAAFKREINLSLGSSLIEEKSYEDYSATGR